MNLSLFTRISTVFLLSTGLVLSNTASKASDETLNWHEITRHGVLVEGDDRWDDGSSYDIHTFEAVAGQLISITLDSNEFDTFLVLENADGGQLAENDDFNFNTNTNNSQITILIEQSGHYQALASAKYREAYGNYTLRIVTAPCLSHVALEQRNRSIPLLLQGSLLLHDRQLHLALEYLQCARYIAREMGDLASEGKAFRDLGRTYYYLAQYKQAIDHHNQHLEIARELGDTRGEGDALRNLGAAYNIVGQYYESLEYYGQSLTLVQELNDEEDEGNVLGQIGLVYSALGQHRKAIHYHEQHLLIANVREDLRGQSAALGNLGIAYIGLEEYDQAINLLKEQLAIAEQTGNRVSEGNALGNLGIAHRRKGLYNQAIEFYQERLHLAREMDDLMAEGRTLGNLGNIYRDQENYNQAIELFYQSLSIFQFIASKTNEKSIPEIGAASASLGWVYYLQRKPEIAIVFLKESVNVRETIRTGIQGLSSDLQQSYTDTIAADYRFLADLLLSQGRIIEAQQVLELLKLEEIREFSRSARSGLESDGGIDLNPVEQDILKEFTTLLNFGKQLYDCEQSRCAELGQYRDQRRRQSSRFNQRVDAFVQTIRDNRADDEFFYDPSRLNETAQAIVAEPGTLLIYPFVTEDQLWLLYTAAGEVAGAVPVAVSQLELGTAVVEFRKLLENPNSDLATLQATGQQLYDWMIAPLSEEIEKNEIDTLVFAQDRVTRYIPMAALWDGNQYLAQRFTLSSILSAQLTDMDDQLAPTDTSVLALGLSDAVTDPDFDFNPLPFVEQEIDRIVTDSTIADPNPGIYPGLQRLNQDFSFDTLFDNVLDYRILHIATHGKFLAGTPDQSFLMLGNGQRLTIPEIESFGSDLDDVHLVVLSACETAVGGPDADGIEVAGISSYFLAANRASAVMASLWKVSDPSTSLLIRRFYENLAQGDVTKAEALQQAQLSFVIDEIEGEASGDRGAVRIRMNPDAEVSDEITLDFSHPYYWAPFILIGNSR